MQALATQEANRAAQNRLPPLWAIVAMVVLGFDEFVAVLYNPLWLVFLLLLFLFARTVYQVGGRRGGGGLWMPVWAGGHGTRWAGMRRQASRLLPGGGPAFVTDPCSRVVTAPRPASQPAAPRWPLPACPIFRRWMWRQRCSAVCCPALSRSPPSLCQP